MNGTPQPAPNLLHRSVGAIAAASFYIYLTHVIVVWVIYWKLGYHNLPVNLAASIALGISTWWASQRFAEWRGPARATGTA